MKNKINIALQVLPQSSAKDSYAIVDEAIKVIQESGVKYKVCPFETVMEGDYDELMGIVKKVQETCYEHGTEKMMTYIKIQTNASDDVTIDDKMEKYQ